MIDLGATSTQIEAKIRIKGYKGSSSTIRKHITDRKELINSNIKFFSY